jgi:hypothetical protein
MKLTHNYHHRHHSKSLPNRITKRKHEFHRQDWPHLVIAFSGYFDITLTQLGDNVQHIKYAYTEIVTVCSQDHHWRNDPLKVLLRSFYSERKHGRESDHEGKRGVFTGLNEVVYCSA